MIVPEVAQHLPEIRALCQQYGVERMSVFGSATNEEKFSPETSDVDCLVKFFDTDKPGIAHRYWTLAVALEKTLHRSVDLVTERMVRNPFFQALVERSKISIYDTSNQKIS